MKFEEMYIEANKEQKPIVCKILEENGFMPKVGMVDICVSDDGFISTYASGRYSTYPEALFGTVLTFDEFMQRYSKNEMIKKIHQAKKELGLNNTELSLRMGKSKPYIAKMLNQPQSEKVQQAVIKQLDDMLIKCEEKPIAVNKEISDLKKEIEQKTVLVGKLSDQLEAAEKLHNKDLKALKDKDDQLLAIVESKEQAKREIDYFVNQFKRSESDVNSLKSKIKRERIIILIVIAILTALFFLKGSIGG